MLREGQNLLAECRGAWGGDWGGDRLGMGLEAQEVEVSLYSIPFLKLLIRVSEGYLPCLLGYCEQYSYVEQELDQQQSLPRLQQEAEESQPQRVQQTIFPILSHRQVVLGSQRTTLVRVVLGEGVRL